MKLSPRPQAPRIAAPTANESFTDHEGERRVVQKILAYWPALGAWEVEVAGGAVFQIRYRGWGLWIELGETS